MCDDDSHPGSGSGEGWVVLIEKDLAMVARVRVVLAWILGCHPAGGPGADG